MDEATQRAAEWLLIVVPIVLGIVVGVLANLATGFLKTGLLPLYRNLVYRGFRVDGSWLIQQENAALDGGRLEDTWSLCAKLKQKAYVVKGTATATQQKEYGSLEDALNYEVSGSIYDRILSLTFRCTENDRFAHSVFLLEVEGGGSRMSGYRTFYGLRRQRIRAIESTWRRPRSGDPCRSTLTTAEPEPQEGPASPSS